MSELILARLGDVNRLGLGVPLLVMALLGMVILPLPPFALDAFFTFNITLSLIIVLAVVYIPRPLEFAVFPTVLLATTLLRLALNVASTRVVLLEGHTGPDAAGKVIEAFGAVVVGGNYAVGLIVFFILVVINFVVVTKGAARVSEVTARFTLDAMPGKQMAIDADLNAGILTQEEALKRRNEVREEADFYGAMDGTSKFVRGDAIAGILILLLNVIGGLFVGVLQHDLTFADAGRLYTLLTIGDGLVAQIPSLLLSTSVAIIVTRMSRAQALTEQVLEQVFFSPRILTTAGSVLALLGLLPGMPNVAFLGLGAAALYAGYHLQQRAAVSPAEAPEPEPPPSTENADLTWDDLSAVDLIGLEVGYRLIPLVDRNRNGPLLSRIKGVRRKLSDDLGFLIQPVHIRDNLELRPNSYRISVLGVPLGEGEIQLDRELAINPGHVSATLTGTRTTDPAFGLEAYWIEPAAREHAQQLGFTVVDTSTVIATHISELLKRNAHKLLGHEEVQELLDRLAAKAPKLVENLTPNALPLSTVVQVIRELLSEKVPARNIRTIAETLTEQAVRTQNVPALVACVREALASDIAQSIFGLSNELAVITLEPSLEQLLGDSVDRAGDGTPTFEPSLMDKVHEALTQIARRQETAGNPFVLIVSTKLRPWLSRLTRFSLPDLHVLAYGEIPQDKSLRVIASVGDQ